MLSNFNEMVIPGYSPISSKGGKRTRRKRTRRNKRRNISSKNARTRRRYR